LAFDQEINHVNIFTTPGAAKKLKIFAFFQQLLEIEVWFM